MVDSELLNVLREVVKSETGSNGDLINMETLASDIPGWDSLAHTRIIIALEFSLNISIDIDKTYYAKNVEQLIQVIKTSDI